MIIRVFIFTYRSVILNLPPIAKRVKLRDFVEKINDNAITFFAKDSNKLVGLVSCYFNNEAYGFINHDIGLSNIKSKYTLLKTNQKCI